MSDSVQTSKKQTSGGKWQILVFACLSIFLINGFIYTTFNLLLQTVSVDLGWTGEERALVATGISTGMIWFVFIAGLAIDKFSVKKFLGSFQIIAAVLVFLRGSVGNATIYFAVMFLFGICAAMFAPSTTKLIGLWFNQKDLAMANGFLTAASPLGQIVGNLLSIPIANALGGWSRLFWLQGVLLLVLGLCTLLVAKDRRNIDAELSSSKITSEEDLGLWKNLKSVGKVPQFWLYVVAHAAFLGMIYGGGSMSYVVLQVDPKWGLDAALPGVVVSFNNIASMCMYMLAPLLIGKFLAKNYEKNYRRLAVVCGLIAGISMSIGWRTYSFAAICVCYLIGGLTFGQIVPVPKVLMMKLPEVSGPRAGTGLGILHTVERIAQAVITAALGLIVASNPENGGVMMSYLCLLYCVSPILILVAMQIDKRQERKAQTASAT